MPFAVTLRLDQAGTAAVEAAVDALAGRGVSTSVRRLGYAPHVTLAVCTDAAEHAKLVETVRRVAAEWPALPIACPALGLFPDPPIAFYVAVTATQALLRRHAALAQALPADRLHPHYRPDAWLPHVTLADDLQPNRVPAAMAAALPAFRPFLATLERVDVVHFRPVRVLWHAMLGGGVPGIAPAK